MTDEKDADRTKMQRGGARRPVTAEDTTRRKYRIAKLVAVVAGLVGVLLAIAMPFLPVSYTKAQINWPQASAENGGRAGGAVENVVAPNVSYTPVALDATVPCRLAADLPESGGVLLATVPERGAEAGKVGLFVRATNDRLLVTQRNTVLLNIPRDQAEAAPSCEVVLTGDTGGLRGEVRGLDTADDDAPSNFELNDSNARPQIIGVYTGLPKAVDADGLSFSATVDTRFVSSPTTLKLIAAIVGVLLTITSMAALAVLDRRDGRRGLRWLPGRVRRRASDPESGGPVSSGPVGGRERREPDVARTAERKPWWRITLLDTVVVGVLVIWLFVGGNTADDGYQVTVGRVAPDAGYLDNYYRYFGVPQDPFGWHYQYLALWMQVSTATPWLRLLPLLFALVGWFLLSRAAFGRIGRAVSGSATARWAGALGFLAVWLAFNNGLRVEPALAVGILATWLLVERAVATGRLFPLTLGIVVAAFTLTIHPVGAIAALSLLAALRPIIKRLRMRIRRDGWLSVLAPILAAGTLVLYEVFADQPLASILEGLKVQSVVGPTNKWWTEAMRYYVLQNPVPDGSIARRIGIFVTILSVLIVVLVLLRKRQVRHVASGPVWRLVAVVTGAVAVLAFSPTKATHQMGVFACLTGVLVAVATAYMAPTVICRRANRTFLAAAATYVLAVTFAGRNQWWYVGSYGIPWFDDTPHFAGIGLYIPILLVAVALTVVGAWQYYRDDQRIARGDPVVEWTTGIRGAVRTMPSASLIIVLAIVLVFNLVSFGKAIQSQRGSWSWASSNAKALQGKPCALADAILVEADPNTGLLGPARVAGQNVPSPGRALSGVDMSGFVPDGVAAHLENTDDSDEDAASVDRAQTDPDGSSDSLTGTSGSADTGGGSTAQRGVNGSSVRLPFGLDPARVPVLGSYGIPDGRAHLTSDWYQLPERNDKAPLLTMSVAGEVEYIDELNVTHPGTNLRMEFGRVEPDGQITSVASMVPLGFDTAPEWRNLRFPLDGAPSEATVTRIVADDDSMERDQWLAVTPPRVTGLVTITDLVGSDDPALLDWEVALAFPCQRPATVRNGILEVPKWRVIPDVEGERVNSRRWMAGDYGGPLGIVENSLQPVVLPSYLRGRWAKDWGSLQRLIPLEAQAPAQLDVTEDVHNGLWTPGPMRAITN